jgi:hypothetical protein
MKKILLITFIFVIIIVSLLFINIKNYIKQEQNKKRYEEIKKDIDNELKRYMYVIAPKYYL